MGFYSSKTALQLLRFLLVTIVNIFTSSSVHIFYLTFSVIPFFVESFRLVIFFVWRISGKYKHAVNQFNLHNTIIRGQYSNGIVEIKISH